MRLFSNSSVFSDAEVKKHLESKNAAWVGVYDASHRMRMHIRIDKGKDVARR